MDASVSFGYGFLSLLGTGVNPHAGRSDRCYFPHLYTAPRCVQLRHVEKEGKQYGVNK